MAAHISIAKAAFSASLLRPDVTKVSRDNLLVFHDAFETMLTKCSDHNVQTCKQWLLENVVVSTVRTTALGKYLVTLSRHLASQEDESTRVKPFRRQRLHILYLVNDLLHHGKYHAHDQSVQSTLTQSLQPFVVELVRLSACEARSRVARHLSDVVDIWGEDRYFAQGIITQLQSALTGTTEETGPAAEPTTQAKDPPYLLPSTHGDPASPYFDLPAGNLMRHIVPNSSQPMRIDEIRALQLSAGPADDSLVNALKDFLKDVDGIERSFSRLEEAGLSPELDELGQISYHDEAGDLVGDTYYGWSRAFCEKMKKRGRRGSAGSSQRSRTRSTSRSRSITSRKRRRRSNSSRGRSRSSGSYSRSPSRPRYGGQQKRGSRSASHGRSRSGSYSPEYTPELVPPMRSEPARTNVSTGLPPVVSPPNLPPPTAAPPASIGMPFPILPFTPSGVSVPPPQPPHWIGPWPPPPPPQFSPGHAGYLNLPLPPPPPPHVPYPPAGWPAYPNVPPGQNPHYAGGRQ
ncbi:hypothetical protein A1O7_04683 [Cladophialophora yegresii CBS 114405]|uniref:CID domain-containing protein n=1 Tax=Cladophialophora yegresii CBS 114405 TaxID=1182544 RepID=W9W6B1_9EURO|nr:uncharacterized protein A1O7_04683 [Cladophialophora yegresii CBS 114405]EXJ60530.1 hypothetical protein A1O7_04683 [Cladophialophora yegresii CBS 114405]